MTTPNPYDVADDGCECHAWSAFECGCGRFVDPTWRRIWQAGYDAAMADNPAPD